MLGMQKWGDVLLVACWGDEQGAKAVTASQVRLSAMRHGVLMMLAFREPAMQVARM